MEGALKPETALKYYSRKDVQEEIVYNAKNREVAVKYFDAGFGKRPDILAYPKDILEFAKQGASSFHASEELWSNPLRLDPMLKKKELDELRSGWDLILDVDFEIWEITKIITSSLIKALKENGITSISLKFSGNKGFHIGVPFEAFPSELNGKKSSDLFPEAVRDIAYYLVSYIDNKKNGFKISNEIEQNILKKVKGYTSYLKEVCENCLSPYKKRSKRVFIFLCPYCNETIESEDDAYQICKKCKKLMEKKDYNIKEKKCEFCGGKIINKFELNIDTLLISSRHLYRMPYSLHEKSGLVSLPINPNKVLEFEKSLANPEQKISRFRFLDKERVLKNEGKELLLKSLEFAKKRESIKDELIRKKEYKKEEITSAIPEEFFPPCIKKGLNGMQDGKKRFLFILVNFLISVGWSYEDIEKRILEWNKKNEEPLRDVNILGQIRYHKQQRKNILPPNCLNKMYYVDMQICIPDNLCKRIKNPVNYAVIRARSFRENNIKEDGK